ncbi:hypothetical protein B0T26DRAFT_697424 [Lasiosphaeria miniovina]|uniref:Uncharacterized protein n=1 Tax=Lasiosphaeria miniovina TaxID=1954250 RepID=A0AA40B638_9PEZI|nr:uncharacterized protein B0T26DRAFT_697424 [Lasiosphaeria miniovina]KAK0728259.1 hypothetical protein B0T26DRAFT_697424 [Lasiosphaeria miniovina]
MSPRFEPLFKPQPAYDTRENGQRKHRSSAEQSNKGEKRAFGSPKKGLKSKERRDVRGLKGYT